MEETVLSPESFRRHSASSLSRGLLTGLLSIYAGTAFVTLIGATNYAALIFWAFTVSWALYALSLFLAPRAIQRIYGGLVAVTLALSFASWARPSDARVLFLLAVGAWVLDTVGIHAALLPFQSSDPLRFRELLQRVNHYELIGRAVAAVWMLCESRADGLYRFHYLVWAAAGVHLACLAAAADEGPQTAPVAPWAGIRASASFVAADPLVRIALLGFIWARAAKLSVESVFYQSIQSALPSVSDAGLLVSGASACVLVATVAYQRLAGEEVGRRASVSTLLAVLPAGVLLFCGAALALPKLWVAVALMVFYPFAFKTLFYPTLRQCLASVPPRLSHQILSIVMLVSLA
ncbi:MAG: hypothetical protein HY925_00080, partial [Elusimicrobia bacterium]|nr:hypothetical protein [Elusimicrobiota bacterium]